jgi:hypothetical protein
VRVVERGEELRLPLKTRDALAVARKGVRQQLEGDLAPEPRVARAPDVAHASDAEEGENLIRAEARSGLHVSRASVAVREQRGKRAIHFD